MLIAFVNNDRSAKDVLENSLSTGVSRVLFISEEELTVKNINSIAVDYVNITEYQPIDLDQKVLREIDRRYEIWLHSNKRLKDILTEKCIGSVVRMSFDAVIFQFFRRVVLSDIIINKYQPDKIITDQHWSTFIAFERYESVQCHTIGAPQCSNTYGVKSIIKALLSNVKYTFLTFFGGMLCPVIIGKIINCIVGATPYKSELLLVGATQSRKSFMPVWKKMTTGFASHSELKYATISLRAIQNDIKEKTPWLDGLASFCEFPRLSLDFFRLTLCYFNAKNGFPVPNSNKKSANEVDFASDFSINIDYFFLRTFAKALQFSRLASCFTKLPQLQAVVFTTLSPASRALSLAMQGNGIKTITATHGMVLEPIAYRSEDSVKLTWSIFDSKLLAKYSNDKLYFSLPANPEGFKIENADEVPCWSVLKSYPLAGFFVKNNNSIRSYFCNNRKIAIIFPSTNQHGQALKRFLVICLNNLLANRDKYRFDSIFIKPKKHPRTKIEEFDKILSEIIPSSLTIPVVLTWDIDINTALKASTFALCSHSSIFLDCLRLAVPFSVYTYGSLSNKEFLEKLPGWMTFTNEDQLGKITHTDLSNFECTAKNLADEYWGKVGNATSFFGYFVAFIKGKGYEKGPVYPANINFN